MAFGGTSGWKVFGIIVIALAIVAAIGTGAFLLGRASDNKGATTSTTTPTATQTTSTAAPQGNAAPQGAGQAGSPGTGTQTAKTTPRTVIGTEQKNVACIGVDGTTKASVTVTVTHYSDGTSETSQPNCPANTHPATS